MQEIGVGQLTAGTRLELIFHVDLRRCPLPRHLHVENSRGTVVTSSHPAVSFADERNVPETIDLFFGSFVLSTSPSLVHPSGPRFLHRHECDASSKDLPCRGQHANQHALRGPFRLSRKATQPCSSNGHSLHTHNHGMEPSPPGIRSSLHINLMQPTLAEERTLSLFEDDTGLPGLDIVWSAARNWVLHCFRIDRAVWMYRS